MPLARPFLRWILPIAVSLLVLISISGTRSRFSNKAPLSEKNAAAPKPGPVAIAQHFELPRDNRILHHAAHLTRSASGKLLCFWFAGSREGAPDVRILRSEFDGEKWSQAEPILDPKTTRHLTLRHIRKVGNPVTWIAPDGSLHLYVVTVTLGGWSGSRIAHLVSHDDGRTFVSGKMLHLSPFLNFSTLVKGAVLDAGEKSILPVYHEFMYIRPLVAILDANGDVASVRRIGSGTSLLQPSVTRKPSGGFVACLRNYDQAGVRVSESADGLTWGKPAPCDLPNPNSAVAVANMPDGRPILAFNDSSSERATLALAIRQKNGVWLRSVIVFSGKKELSYPSMIASDDALHLAYSEECKNIAHEVIPWALLNSPEKDILTHANP